MTTQASNEQGVLKVYFNDLYALLMKRLAQFAIDEHIKKEDSIKILALTQELIKIKELLQ
jgi:hypothetical protein